jgi:hypothetical protein
MASREQMQEVRQHRRQECRLSIGVTPTADQAPHLVLGAGAARAAGEHMVMVDFSAGGIGLRGPVFFPRGATLTLTLAGMETGDENVGSIVFHVRVQRVVMVDRGPTYYLGTAFISQAAAAKGLDTVRALQQAQGGPDG